MLVERRARPFYSAGRFRIEVTIPMAASATLPISIHPPKKLGSMLRTLTAKTRAESRRGHHTQGLNA
jgi:hypothetical protein